MRSPLELGEILKLILSSNNVYYQPPETVKLSYPCIIYKLDNKNVQHADNIKYLKHNRYEVMIIDKNVLSEIPSKLEDTLKYVDFDRPFVADNLHHFVYNVYF